MASRQPEIPCSRSLALSSLARFAERERIGGHPQAAAFSFQTSTASVSGWRAGDEAIASSGNVVPEGVRLSSIGGTTLGLSATFTRRPVLSRDLVFRSRSC